MESLIERARKGEAPVISGEQATFIWEGDRAPGLGGDFNNWGWRPGDEEERTGLAVLEEIAPGVWAHTITLPRDAYIEYAYFDSAKGGGKRLRDPLNPRTIWNG